MDENDKIQVRAERVLSVPMEAAFAAWLDPVTASKFLFATEHGTILRCDIDGQEGGEFTIVDRREDEDIEHAGEFVEIAAPRSIVFDFSVNQSPVSRVAVNLAPERDGTRVTLTHTMDAQWANYADRARKGWETILEKLERALA